jgi:hypothetical protein
MDNTPWTGPLIIGFALFPDAADCITIDPFNGEYYCGSGLERPMPTKLRWLGQLECIVLTKISI